MVRMHVCLILSTWMLVLTVTTQAERCTNGELKLEAGKSKFEGRLEICSARSWHTICSGFIPDRAQNKLNAGVACRQLGFSDEGAGVLGINDFSKGKGKIHSKLLQCTGRERRVTACPTTTARLCSHIDDLGIRCSPSDCQNGEVRLANSTAGHAGRVEVCTDRQWGSVCDDHWGHVDATVVCRQLGLSADGAIGISFGYFGRAPIDPILLDNVECSGVEAKLTACNHTTRHTCTHKEDAGVVCKAPCTDGSIQLVDGESANEGTVEVCLNAVWTAVCSKNWTSQDANVACNQLGYEGKGHRPVMKPYNGSGFKPIAISNPRCRGDEKRLVDCSVINVGVISGGCTHLEDVGVICKGKSTRAGDSVTTTSGTETTTTTNSRQDAESPTLKARKLFNSGATRTDSSIDIGPAASRCSNTTLMIVGGVGVLLLILLLVLLAITIWLAVRLNQRPKQDPRGGYSEVPQREVENPMYGAASDLGLPTREPTKAKY